MGGHSKKGCLQLVIGLGTLSDKKSRYYEDTAELEPKLGRWEDTKAILGIRYFLPSVSLFRYPFLPLYMHVCVGVLVCVLLVCVVLFMQ